MPLVIKMLKLDFSPKTPNFECNSALSEMRVIEINKDFQYFLYKEKHFPFTVFCWDWFNVPGDTG